LNTLNEHVNDFSWLTSLAYLSDLLIHLNSLNLSLQEAHVNIFKVEDKIEVMIDSWNRRFPFIKEELRSISKLQQLSLINWIRYPIIQKTYGRYEM